MGQLPSKLTFYDTLTGKKKPFIPKAAPDVAVYGCGPTVYGLIHVGNGRAFLVQDSMVRALKFAGYNPIYARNYTDIDDKIINVAHKTGQQASEVASHFAAEFDADMDRLGVLTPSYRPKVSQTMVQVIEMVRGLVASKHAYVAQTEFGMDVFYSVESFKPYGKLSKRPIDEMSTRSRVDLGEGKQGPLDFALWKAAKPGEPSWDSPWGKGRPGWHIECSAMIDSIFDKRLDIHMGGADLVFPHHENEIAQSEGLRSEALATCWVHNGMINIDKEKMSKSLGNICLLREFLDDFGPEVFKLLCHQTHYRKSLDFSRLSILRAEMLVERFYQFKSQALELGYQPVGEGDEQALNGSELGKQAVSAIYDDLNFPKALGLILKEAKTFDKSAQWHDVFVILNNLFGVSVQDPETALQSIKDRKLKRTGFSPTRCEQIERQLEQRTQLRSEGKYDEADALRVALEAEGIVVMDGPQGSTWDVEG